MYRVRACVLAHAQAAFASHLHCEVLLWLAVSKQLGHWPPSKNWMLRCLSLLLHFSLPFLSIWTGRERKINIKTLVGSRAAMTIPKKMKKWKCKYYVKMWQSTILSKGVNINSLMKGGGLRGVKVCRTLKDWLVSLTETSREALKKHTFRHLTLLKIPFNNRNVSIQEVVLLLTWDLVYLSCWNQLLHNFPHVISWALPLFIYH